MVLNYIDHSDPSTWKTGKEVEEMRAVYEGWDPRYATHHAHARCVMRSGGLMKSQNHKDT